MSDLLGDEAVWLAENGPALGVTQDDPVAAAVLDHLRRNFAAEVTPGNLSTRKKKLDVNNSFLWRRFRNICI